MSGLINIYRIGICAYAHTTHDMQSRQIFAKKPRRGSLQEPVAEKRSLRLRQRQNPPKNPCPRYWVEKRRKTRGRWQSARRRAILRRLNVGIIGREPRIKTVARRFERETSPMQGAHRENSLTKPHVKRMFGVPVLWKSTQSSQNSNRQSQTQAQATRNEIYTESKSGKLLTPLTRQTSLLTQRSKSSQERQKEYAPRSESPQAKRAVSEPETAAEKTALDEVFAKAERAKPELDRITNEIARQFNGIAVIVPLKGRARTLAKLRADYNGDASKLKDVARSTVEVRTLEDARAAIAELSARFGNPKRNTIDGDPEDGYRDALFHVFVGGSMVEIQVHVPAILFAKTHVHGLYEKRETIKRQVKTEGRELTEKESALIARLNAIMRRVYGQALSGNSSAKSSGLQEKAPLALSSSSEMGRGNTSSDGSNNQTPDSPRLTAASSESGTSKNPTADGNAAITLSNNERSGSSSAFITVDTIRDYPGPVTVKSEALPESSLWSVFDRAKFDADPNAQLVPLDRLISRKDERNDPKFKAGTKPYPIATAYKFMLLAKQGKEGAKARAPLNVTQNPDGTFEIQDGNATAQVLMLAGWKSVPVIVAPSISDAPQAKRVVADPNQLDIFGNNPVTNAAPTRKEQNNENTKPTKPRRNKPVIGDNYSDLFLAGLQTDPVQPGETPELDFGETSTGPRGTGNAPGRPAGSGAIDAGGGAGGKGGGALGGTQQGGTGNDEGGVRGDLGQAGAGVTPAAIERPPKRNPCLNDELYRSALASHLAQKAFTRSARARQLASLMRSGTRPRPNASGSILSKSPSPSTQYIESPNPTMGSPSSSMKMASSGNLSGIGNEAFITV